MSALGQALVVFSDTTLCDGRQHEVRLITDGTRAHAYAAGHDLPLIRRTGTQVIVSCTIPDAADQDCHGEATFDLDTPAWLSASRGDGPEALDLLTRYGSEVER